MNYIAKAKKATTQSTTLLLISNVCFSNFMRKVFFVILVLIIYMYLLYIYKGVDVVEWSRALDVKLSEWCCSVSMVWVQIYKKTIIIMMKLVDGYFALPTSFISVCNLI